MVSKDEYRKLFYEGKIDTEYVYEPFLELEVEKLDLEDKDSVKKIDLGKVEEVQPRQLLEDPK